MRLPSFDQDHFELDDGEARNSEFPEDFWIPPKELRQALEPGDIVKLIFRMEESVGSEDISVERMWVEVTSKHDGYYQGVLDNDPSGSECIEAGHEVTFQPRHIIDVYEGDT